MTTLKEEEPFASVVSNDFFLNTCSYCFAHKADKIPFSLQGTGGVHLCKGCHVVAYCNEKCQKSDWINHKNECQILKKVKLESNGLPSPHVRLTMRILLKSEKQLAKTAFNGRTWSSLDHLEEVQGAMSTSFYANVAYIMEKLIPVKNLSRVQVANAFSRVIVNSMGIIESAHGRAEVGFGIYLGLSFHKHSCIPDSQIIFTGSKASLRGFDQAQYSPNLTISYCDVAPWDADRKKSLKRDRFVECTCPLCTDENHIMNRMGSSCYVSCCEDAAGILDENSSGPYRCNKCGKASTIMFIQVKLAQEKIKLHMETILGTEAAVLFDVNKWMKKTMDLLMASEKVLSVYNFYVVHLSITIRGNAAKNALHEISKYAHEKALKAVEYYLHEMDRRRAICLTESTTIKHILNSSDFDDHKALKAVIRAFGKDHPVTVHFKNHVEEFDLFSAFERAQISSVLRSQGRGA